MDTIADFLTIIRNGVRETKSCVTAPMSSIKLEILKILKSEGFIVDYDIDNTDSIKKRLKIHLKYGPDNQSVIHEITQISKQSKRRYVKKRYIPKVMNGFGICVLSTPKGLLTGRNARLANIGGELLFQVW
ncbi:MAG: 30S ribosomal protein S8 [bacterium]